jgi:hypothetical protein
VGELEVGCVENLVVLYPWRVVAGMKEVLYFCLPS